MMLRIPQFEQVSTNPDRDGTEDYKRKNFEKQLFYNTPSQKSVNEPSKTKYLDPNLIIGLSHKIDSTKELFEPLVQSNFSDEVLEKLIDEEIDQISSANSSSSKDENDVDEFSSEDEDDVDEFLQGEEPTKKVVLATQIRTHDIDAP